MKSIIIIKHEKVEGPGMIEEYLRSANRPYNIIELWDGSNLPPPDDCGAVISLGGSMNVYEEDRFPFLRAEDIFLRNSIKHDIPTLGICLGAQLLAKCAGAKVKKNGKEEVGWCAIGLQAEAKADPLFSGAPNRFETFQWHGDTFEIPDNGVLLASSPACANQAMRIGRSAWGLQFHPEMTVSLIRDWCHASIYHKAQEKQFINHYILIEEAYKSYFATIFSNFINLPHTFVKEFWTSA